MTQEGEETDVQADLFRTGGQSYGEGEEVEGIQGRGN